MSDLEQGLATVKKVFQLCCGHEPQITVGKKRLVIEGRWSLMLVEKGRWMLYLKSAIPQEVRFLRDDPKQEYDYLPYKKDPKTLKSLLPALVMQYALQRIKAGLQQLEGQ